MRRKAYIIEWDKSALKQFQKIKDTKLQDKVLDIIEDGIAKNILIGKPLKEPFKGLRSYRIGKLRIIYKIYQEKLIIVILNIEHRKDVYR